VFKSAPYDFKNSELSVKRIKLFLKALELHKLVIFKHRDKFSFLLKKFINILRSPRVEVKDDDVSLESLWDVFFFVVPVTSTTLASFSRMFGLVEDEFIDYLLVDEAGQAQVHSFVMPLVKSKRAIIVGDPFQIEPVYNITSGLDDILCSFFEIPLEFSVTENSVQTYADRVSLLGGIYEVGGRKVRVGVPLNVHRRCNSPMFDIANRIAYSGCMIKGKMDSFKVRDLLPERLRVSRWFHVEFKPNESGVVEEEIKLLSELLVEIERSLVEKGVDVREFVKRGNIFVITPFRAVRDRLRNMEREGGIWSYLVGEGNFIGTIHTFQGKEANIVFVVLGGRSERSMAWASSKPNLLNVALTRAKELCFVIGDKNLWGRMPYFKDAVEILDRWSRV
ncbi:MAG: DEAD/DEAH box helicase, partial [Archaeoglobaceae archaeon]